MVVKSTVHANHFACVGVRPERDEAGGFFLFDVTARYDVPEEDGVQFPVHADFCQTFKMKVVRHLDDLFVEREFFLAPVASK